jgi:hypothetical protein
MTQRELFFAESIALDLGAREKSLIAIFMKTVCPCILVTARKKCTALSVYIPRTMANDKGSAVNRFLSALIICAAAGLTACGYSSNGSNLTPVVTGTWMMTFAPAAQGGTTPPSTSLTANFNQNGNTLSAMVTAVNNPPSSCFPAISSNGTNFTVSGQVSTAASSNLNVSVAFMSGSSSGTIMGTGALAYLSTMANGTFSFGTAGTACSTGTFTMAKIG